MHSAETPEEQTARGEAALRGVWGLEREAPFRRVEEAARRWAEKMRADHGKSFPERDALIGVERAAREALKRRILDGKYNGACG
jgi:hypothetical protein